MESSRSFVVSLARGLSVLSLVSETRIPLTLSELSRKLGLSKGAVQRLTYTLRQLGYLDRNGEDKRFRVGPKTLSMGFSIMERIDLKRIAYPYLENLWREMGETVNLGILNGFDIVYVERIKGQHTLNVDIKIGSRLPVYCTSMGRAMLAFLPEERWDDFLSSRNIISLTPRTLTKRETILKELRKAKLRGFATNNEEVDLGIRSVAAPIRNLNGDVVAAVNIAVPSIRVSLRKLETILAKKVVETADRISSSLGYKFSFRGDRKGYSRHGGEMS